MSRAGNRGPEGVSPVKARAREILARTGASRMTPLMDELRRILVEQSDTAFLNQRFGPRFVWPPKYPNQSDANFISVAGALDDFNRGRTAPQPRQFRRRPALIGTQRLRTSVFARRQSRAVISYGSSDPIAPAHQHGELVDQAVTKRGRRKAQQWLATPDGAPYRSKLSKLTDPKRTVLQTDINQRPFIGITRETGARLVHRVEEFFNAP